jgi:putative transposase
LSRWRSLAGTTWLGQDDEMTSEPATYPGYRFPAEIISHAIWLVLSGLVPTGLFGRPRYRW